MVFKRLWFTISILFLFCFTACKFNEDKLVIGEDFYYLPTNAESTISDAVLQKDSFLKLEDHSTKNLENILGTKGHFVWIRAEFEIPERLKNQPLGLVIPYLRMAEQLYINGNFVAQFGSFPPNEKSCLYKCHYFNFPIDVLNQEGTNTILIKVWSHGQSAISPYSYINLARYAHSESDLLNFAHSRIYIIFVGGLFFTFILYFLLYLTRKKSKEHLDFALLNFFTMFFITVFFAPEVPWYTALPFLLFMKVSLCISFYWMFYFISSFIYDFEHTLQPAKVSYIRIAIPVSQTIFTAILPDYDSIMALTVPMFIMSLIELGFGVFAFFRNLIFIKKRRKNAILQFLCFVPVLLSIAIDIVLRVTHPNQIFCFYTIFGWQITIIIFIVVLALRYAKVYGQNETLTEHLQEEVALRTLELQDANYELSVLNEKLEREKINAEMDLDMASIVQKKFFPPSKAEFSGWDLSICYQPLSKVSGDLYDYYSNNDKLDGFSLFDVSGHGISASLVTMLSKNIISRTFSKGLKANLSTPEMLTEINELINHEKGNIDNYLTGLICRMKDFNKDDSIDLSLGNAGHPYPYLFSATNNQIITLFPSENQEHCGAIGMCGIHVSFPEINFKMYKDDVLVCFTDGLTEMLNDENEQFGRGRIENIIMKNHDKNSTQIMLALKESLKEFTGTREWDDDLTILVLKRKDSSIPVDHPEIEELFSLS